MKIKSILKKIKKGSTHIQLSEEKNQEDKLKNDALKTIECLKREYCSGCGAAMTDEFIVNHIIIDSADKLDMLRKSKYVQSDTGSVYSQIKKLLNKNIPVLFCGCPCQVAGLYAALQNTPTDRLYTIDLMCHGSPSPGVFRKYIDECYDRSQLEFIGFREKDHFGWSTEMTVKYKDGSIKRASRLTDPYYKAFLSCLSTREYCGNCEFSKLPRQGDIRQHRIYPNMRIAI